MGMPQLMQLVVGANDAAGYPGAFVTIAGAALNHLAKGVVERDAVGRTLMKALHAAAEMELFRPEHRPGIGRPPEDRVAGGKPGKNTTLIGHQQARGAQIAAERQQAVRFTQGAFRRREGDRMPGELNQTHFNLNTHQQKLDNSLQTLFKLEVPALFSEQLRVTTLLNYLAVVHDYYLIKTRQASQAVGDHQHGFLA
ncbi:conserved hypothetical protein [Klebsiella quasipneumoniae subsp. similipneumoniae]|nr:conserved hypothetical protein [Klebsiella quasipneumoniae subsp. similipneumoniae]